MPPKLRVIKQNEKAPKSMMRTRFDPHQKTALSILLLKPLSASEF